MIVLLLLIEVSAIGFGARPARTESATIVVPDDFPTIQEAINNAVDGDTVFVKTGTYYEHVVVNKTLSLVGENSSTATIDGNWTGIVIKVTQNSVNISDLTVQRSGSVYWENAGIFLSNVENCSIGESILTQNSFAGLELNHSRRCNISENNILSNGGVGITLVGGSFKIGRASCRERV
jgi:parallel beta-helix repeat protein